MRPDRTLATCTEFVVLALMIVSGLATWAAGIESLGYDYDEVMRAHSTWLAAQGLIPYRDFLDCHPPYFRILAPIVRACAGDPCALLWSLRILSAIGNLLFVGGLAALGASRVRSGSTLALFGLALVAFQPPILAFLVESRIDGWGYALGVWSIYRFGRHSPGAYRNFELGLLTGIATLLFCPKLALLPPLLVLADQVVARTSARRAGPAMVAYLGGAGVAMGLFAVYLAWQGIDFGRTFQLLVRYNAISNANLGIHFGLLQSIVSHRLLTFAIVAGVFVWSVDLCRHRTQPDAYLGALVIWLVLQSLLVSYPYKQYFAPWFLFASSFVVYLCRRLSDWLGAGRLIFFVAASAVTGLADFQTSERWLKLGEGQSDRKLIKWMNKITRPEDRVVGAHPVHPIDRYDSFLLSFNTFNSGGFDAERILAQLPIYQRSVTALRFREELEKYPPGLVVISGDWRIVPYTRGQRDALGDFLHQRGYQTVHVGSAWFALRPDRFEQARGGGLLEALSSR